MFTNYLKTFFRTLKKHKLYSVINIAGLAIGMASCLLILQYVRYEFGYDSFWKNSDSIYRIRHDQYQNGILQMQSARTFAGVGQAMFNEIPEIKNYTSFSQDEVMCYTEGNATHLNNQNFYWVDTTFFKVFPMEFVYGSRQTAFQNYFSSVISQSAAQKLFGNENPVGKWYKVNEGWAFCVTGVFKDIPENSHLKMNFIASNSSIRYYMRNWDNATGMLVSEELQVVAQQISYTDNRQWRRVNSYTYILAKPNTDPQVIESKLQELGTKYTQNIIHEGGKVVFSLQYLRDIHLSSHLQFELGVNGDKNLTIALLITAIIILIIAWVNYVNLSVVKSMDRAKETALRKVVGADRSQLVRQFMTESVLINIIAIILSLLCIKVMDFIFIQLFGRSIVNNVEYSSLFLVLIIFLLFAGTILSGIYPALILSSFKPVDLFKKEISAVSGKISLRKLLLGFQFVAAIILMTVTFVVYKQISFMQNQDLGVNVDRILYVRSPYTMIKKPERMERLQTFKSELKRINGIKNVTTSSSIPGAENLWHRDDVRKINTDPNQKNDFSLITMDEDFISTFGLKMISGRNFLQDGSDQSSVLLNESAAKLLGYNNSASAVNELIQVGNDQYRVVGITANYHHEYLKKPIQPTLFFYGYNWRLDVGFYSIKINSENVKFTLNSIKSAWNTLYPQEPFDYFFLDQTYQKQYEADQQFGMVFTLFSILSLALTCFGIFGLTSYNAMKRTKEIGIRKVIGASDGNIFYLLNKEFIQLLIASFIIALPVCIYIAKLWLENYSYRIGLNVLLFIIPLLVVSLIVFLTMSYQSIKAAHINPAQSLKYE